MIFVFNILLMKENDSNHKPFCRSILAGKYLHQLTDHTLPGTHETFSSSKSEANRENGDSIRTNYTPTKQLHEVIAVL